MVSPMDTTQRASLPSAHQTNRVPIGCLQRYSIGLNQGIAVQSKGAVRRLVAVNAA